MCCEPAPTKAFSSPRTNPKNIMARRSFLLELLDFIKTNKAYFLAPIILVLLLVGVLIILGGTKAAPFIYTLF